VSFQKKLWRLDLDKEFWEEPDRSISYLMRDMLVGRDIARLAASLKLAGVHKCSDSLLYKFANPNEEARPSFKQFILTVKLTENCEPISALARACGIVPGPYSGDLAQDLKGFLEEWQALHQKAGGGT
jgi:hypothetical protein